MRRSVFESAEAFAQRAQEGGVLAWCEDAEHDGFDFLGARHCLIQDAPAFGGESEAIDPGICGMCAANQVTATGKPGNRQAHILRSDEGEPREIGRGERIVHREVCENLDLQNREIHIRERGGNFLSQRVSKLRHQAAGAIVRIEYRLHRSTIIASACYCFKARQLFVNRPGGLCI